MPTLTIDEVFLPQSLEAGATFRLTTETHITQGYGGTETRFAKRAPKLMCTLNVRPDHADDVISLFRSQVGPRYAFQVIDPSDAIATDEPLYLDDDGNYPLIKTYGHATREQLRRILCPVEYSISIEVNGSPTGSWTLQAPGIIVPGFGASSGDSVTWSGSFAVPMRFAVDELPQSLLAAQETGILRIVQVNLIEVFEDA